jgi:hypothetical protein
MSNNENPPELKSSFDIDFIKMNVAFVVNRIKELELQGKNDPFDFEMDIMEILPVFYQSHPFLVKTLCKKTDLTILNKMLEQLKQVENGDKSLSGVEMSLGNELADKYLYPVIGKKK